MHVLQIGLGSFGTVTQNLAEPNDAFPALSWLMEAATDQSTSMRVVGVEPVPEHAKAQQQFVKLLPNASIVCAAVSSESKDVTVHAVTAESYLSCLAEVSSTRRKEFAHLAEYVRNMSCVGKELPCFKNLIAALKEDFGVQLLIEPIEAQSLSYDALCRLLNFHGVEVLAIDAEGHDCEILQSMIAHCRRNPAEWPSVIQFETMGHNDNIGTCSESDMMRTLEEYGYRIAWIGQDTVMVHSDSLGPHRHLQPWLPSMNCNHCGVWGSAGFPFEYSPDLSGSLCGICRQRGSRWAGRGWNVWRQLPRHAPKGQELRGICTDGMNL